MIDTNKYTKIVRGIVGKYKSTSRFDQDDLISEGMRVVIKAHNLYDPTIGVPLDAYVIGAVRREIFKYVIANLYDLNVKEGVQRQEYNTAGEFDHLNMGANARYRIGNRGNDVEDNITFEEIFIPASGSHEDDLHKKQCVEILSEEMKKLPEPERQVIQALFLDEKSHKEAAKDLNISVSSISPLRRKGLNILSERIKSRIVEL